MNLEIKCLFKERSCSKGCERGNLLNLLFLFPMRQIEPDKKATPARPSTTGTTQTVTTPVSTPAIHLRTASNSSKRLDPIPAYDPATLDFISRLCDFLEA